MAPDNSTTAPGSKPNILIFMPDQLRYDALGCSGNAIAKTPNIDAFAKTGTRFTNCYAQASVCTQSRVSMFTGQYPHVSGHRSLENMIKPWEPNMFRSLKEGGYHVACLAPRGDLFAPTVIEISVTEYGFIEAPDYLPANWKEGGQTAPADPHDIWHRLFYKGKRDPGESFDYDEGAVRSAMTWLQDPPRQPWVLFLPLFFPHCPFWAEEPYFSMYDRKLMPAQTRLDQKTGYEPRYMKAIRDTYGTHRATPEMWAEVQATYMGMVSRLDNQFGRITSALSSSNLSSTTVTMFFTDHGEYMGDHGLIEKWPSGLSDSLTHEPLIISGAGLPQGKVIDDMTEMVDLVPTIFQMCGIQEHYSHNGQSLLPVLNGTSADNSSSTSGKKSYAFSEGGFLTSEEHLLENGKWPYDLKAGLQHQDPTLVGKAVALRSKEWTYIYRLYEPCELYSRRPGEDPHELHNLAAEPEYGHLVRMFEAVVMRWMVETSDVMPWSRDKSGRGAVVDLESPAEQLQKRKAAAASSRAP
ncbi:hypothetical protein CLAIMM_01021 [Cladophialophora immunda]|nr:hypothetical protein CLAIMM_01021 [Cladophialophora immunda]